MRITVVSKDDLKDKHTLVLLEPLSVGNLKKQLDKEIFSFDGFEVVGIFISDGTELFNH